MNRLSSPAYLHAKAVLPGVLAHGATPEQLVAAEMHLSSLRPTPQRSLFDTVPSNAGVAPCGQPEPSGLADSGSLGD